MTHGIEVTEYENEVIYDESGIQVGEAAPKNTNYALHSYADIISREARQDIANRIFIALPPLDLDVGRSCGCPSCKIINHSFAGARTLSRWL